MIFDLGCSLLLFWGITFGLAWPVAKRLPLEPIEKIVVGATLSLLLVFFAGWTVYSGTLSLDWLWLLPLIAVFGLARGWRSIAATLEDAAARTLLTTQILICAWSAGLLALILSYTGGGWVADWWGHMQRSWFFLDRGPRDILFNGFDALTSRPPLANIINGVFIHLTQRNFLHYQIFSNLSASLAFLPAGLLAHRFGGRVAIPILALLFMANPMFAQNVTYTWTKLPAAFFTLAALYFFLRSFDQNGSLTHAVLFAINLAAGLLTHYSAGPYAVILGAGWFALGWHRRRDPAWWRATMLAVLAGSLVLATWFGWCFSVYGLHGTLMTNTSVTDKAPDAATQFHSVMLNIRDTLVPHFLRQIDSPLLEQRSPVGRLRDWFFQLYQVNFFFAFGSVAWMAILFRLCKQARNLPAIRRNFWLGFIICNALLGIAVHGARDFWGLAHICLQPLIIAGLAFLAAQWRQLSLAGRRILIAAATIDFVLGIGLQLAVEAFAFERWLSPNRSIFEVVADYTQSAQMNFYAKIKSRWVFLGDVMIDHGYLVVVFLAAVFSVTLFLIRSERRNQPITVDS